MRPKRRRGLSVRVPPGALHRLDRINRSLGISREEAVRIAVEDPAKFRHLLALSGEKGRRRRRRPKKEK